MANTGYIRGFEGVGSIGGWGCCGVEGCILNGNGTNSAAFKGLVWHWIYGRLE
jgi:hypothetical protein